MSSEPLDPREGSLEEPVAQPLAEAPEPVAPEEQLTFRSFLRAVADSIRGVPRDYTKGSIGRAVLLLAVPMVLEMSMQSLFMVVDVFFVGKLGPDAVAVVGLCDSLLALVFSVAIGLSMGAAAMVARRVGEGDRDAAAVAAVQVIAVGFVLSIPISILGVIFAPESLRIMGASMDLSLTGAGFTAIMLGGNATVMLLFLINAVFRGAGDPAVAMRALWLANLLNIVFDPLLIFGIGPFPELGLEGAAIATTGARAIGVGYQLWKLGNGSGHIVVKRSHLRLAPAVMLRLLRVSGIGILQYLVSTASFLGLVRILALFGDVALAGYTIAVRIIIFVLLPAWGMGNAGATLVGQNLGAGDPERAEKSVWFTARCNTVFLGLVAVVFVFFSRPLVSVFVPQQDVVAIAAECLRIFSYSYVFWGFGVITVLAFNGAGDTTTPTWINFWVYWAVQIPLAWTLAVPMGWGPTGVFWAICVCQLLLAIVGVVMFRRGTWKTREI
jgi:putative MATE family efflux protein